MSESPDVKFNHTGKNVHQYREIKGKLHRMSAEIWYNKMCKTYHLHFEF
jgi:hypothetical protein